MQSHNAIQNTLIALGLSDISTIETYFPRVRDRDDVSVLRCTRSGVLFLSRTDHINISHYESKEFNGLGARDRDTALRATEEDTKRRAQQFKDIIAGKSWLDIGTGAGGILDALAPYARHVAAVEPQKLSRTSLVEMGYVVYPSVESIEGSFDVITLFHVFEHLVDPIGSLRQLREHLSPGGQIIIEVPHANDFLISFLVHEPFLNFTFWSEHLILHTKESIRVFLEAAGFSNVSVEGLQRYPLANHLYWLAREKPGGHRIWKELRTDVLDQAYASMLASLDKTDTLIATAECPR